MIWGYIQKLRKIINDYKILIFERISKHPVIAAVFILTFCFIFSDVKFKLYIDKYGLIIGVVASCLEYFGNFYMAISVYSSVIGALIWLLGFLSFSLCIKLNIFSSAVATLRNNLDVYRKHYNELIPPMLALNLFKLIYLSALLMIHPELSSYAIYIFWVMVCFGVPYVLKYVINNIHHQ